MNERGGQARERKLVGGTDEVGESKQGAEPEPGSTDVRPTSRYRDGKRTRCRCDGRALCGTPKPMWDESGATKWDQLHMRMRAVFHEVPFTEDFAPIGGD